jgi:hypothetical protein
MPYIPGIPPQSFTAQAHLVNTAPRCGVYRIEQKQNYLITDNTVTKQGDVICVFARVKHHPKHCLLKLVLF